MPRISVIIPTYNRARFIGEAIQSVLDQTYPAWEIVVLDDGSTDDTAHVVAMFGDRVKYIYQDNAGESAARNVGFFASRGEWVSFLDSDDRMLPHNLETLASLLAARPEVAVAYGWYYYMDEHGQLSTRGGPKLRNEKPIFYGPEIKVWPCGTTLEGHILPQLLLEETMLMGSVLIRRACVEAVGAFDPAVHFQAHWNFFLRMAQAGYVYACCRQAVVGIRLHPGNRGQALDEMLASRLAILDRFFDETTLKLDLATVQLQAYYNAFTEFALLNYKRGHLEQGARCLNEALRYAQIRPSDLLQLCDSMSHQALATDVHTPETFLHNLFRALHSTRQLRQLRRKVLGRVNAALAYRHSRSNDLRQLAYRYAVKAVMYEPGLVRDRGLWRLFLEKLIGVQAVHWLRSQWHSLSP